jgi:SAM-dependent methyltransferase
MVKITLHPRNCPICGRREDSWPFAAGNVRLESLNRFAFASRKLPEYMHWPLQECRPCKVLYADPAPRPGELAALYREAGFESGDEASFASRTYARHLRRFLDRLPDRAAALDIGTGDGAFLQELDAAGFEAITGIEPSSAPIESAADSVRSWIRQEIFRPGLFPEGSLSLVTCFQTIEHVADPLALCRDAWRALKPGGALFLVAHNRRAFSVLLLGLKSPIFDLEHLQLFSRASLQNLLTAAGFEGSAIEIRPILNAYPIHYWARLFPFPAGIKARLVAGLARSWLGRRTVVLPAGNLAAVAFKT